MYKYRVVERRAEESRITLRCRRGQYHIARALGVLPLAEAALESDKPHLGFGLLLCPQSGTVYRVMFESIGHTTMHPASRPLSGPTRQPQSASRAA